MGVRPIAAWRPLLQAVVIDDEGLSSFGRSAIAAWRPLLQAWVVIDDDGLASCRSGLPPAITFFVRAFGEVLRCRRPRQEACALESRGERTYRPSLRLFELVSLGVGGTIGSGIFIVPGLAAGIAGPASIAVWALVAVAACAIAGALAALQARSTGGVPFAQLFEPVFGGRVTACLIAFYVLSAIFGMATIAAGLGQYLRFFGIADLRTVELSILAVFLLVNLIGIGLSGRTENVLTVIKLAALLGIAAALAPFVRAENLIPADPVPTRDLLAVAILVFWPFTGFEISAIPVAETRNPKQIARALGLVMALVCLVYLGLNVVLIGAVGSAALAASPAPLASAMGHVVDGSEAWIAVIGIVTMLSALNAYIVAASRVVQNASARFRLAPLAGLSRRGAPAAALVVSCVAAAAMLLWSNRFEDLATAAVLATLVPYIAVCIAAFVTIERLAVRLVAFTGGSVTCALLVLYFVY